MVELYLDIFCVYDDVLSSRGIVCMENQQSCESETRCCGACHGSTFRDISYYFMDSDALKGNFI